jgi:hypothetical protein
MANSQHMVCPVCVRPFQAWYQSSVVSVMCPYCAVEVNVDSRTAEGPPRSRPIHRFITSLATALRVQSPTRCRSVTDTGLEEEVLDDVGRSGGHITSQHGVSW